MTTLNKETGEFYSAYERPLAQVESTAMDEPNPYSTLSETCRAVMFCTPDSCRCKTKKEEHR